MASIQDELLSRYVLFSCEGTAEGVVIERLHDSGRLVVPQNRVVTDPITFRPFTRLRKAVDIESRFFLQNYETEGATGLLVARIADSRSARFALSRASRDAVPVETFLTTPEIEMLAIHAEGAYDDWLRKNKHNRQLKPSEYCTESLGMRDVKRGDFLKDYWHDDAKLAKAIRSYASKRSKKRPGEFVLADLLK